MKTGLLTVVFLSFFAPSAFADLEADLRKVYEGNMAGLQLKNIDKAMETIHTKSPVYENTKLLVEQLFKFYDLKYELLKFKLVGGDDELKIARVSQKTTKVRGKAFSDNITDTIQVFRQEAKTWKIWHSISIDTQYLEPGAASAPSSNRPTEKEPAKSPIKILPPSKTPPKN